MRTAKIFLFLCSVVLAALASGFASSKEVLAGLYAQGNSEYQKGDYPAAERHYRQILDSGADSGTVYYNLGNACFKQKKLGEAIYCWEKARQRMPADRDIVENLELANLMTVDRIETRLDPFPVRFLSRISGLLTIRQESGITLALFIAANLLFSTYLLAKSPRNSFRALVASMAISVLFVVSGCSLSWKIYQRDYRKSGVVIEQKVDVRSGPGPENVTVFTVHEGIKVRVLGAANGWYQVSLPNGWNGWLQQKELGVL